MEPPKSTIESIVTATKDFLQAEIGDLRSRLALTLSEDNVPEERKIRRKIKGRYESIMIMDGMTNNLPESLEFFLYRPVVRSQPAREHIRATFGAPERKGYLKGVFADSAAQKTLMNMGLNQNDIRSYLKNDFTPRLESGIFYDITIDHIVEIANGGLNANNLCVLPGYFNVYKGYFAHIQTRTGQAEILGIRPKANDNGAISVPYISGGFRAKTEDDKILRERMEALLQTKLQYTHQPALTS